MTPMMAGPRRCRAVVNSDHLLVTMGAGGWAFSADVPRSSITTVTRVTGPFYGWGAHGWRGKWLINGSARGLVRISIRPPARARCLFVPVKLKQLTISLDSPDELVAALAAP